MVWNQKKKIIKSRCHDKVSHRNTACVHINTTNETKKEEKLAHTNTHADIKISIVIHSIWLLWLRYIKWKMPMSQSQYIRNFEWQHHFRFNPSGYCQFRLWIVQTAYTHQLLVMYLWHSVVTLAWQMRKSFSNRCDDQFFSSSFFFHSFFLFLWFAIN